MVAMASVVLLRANMLPFSMARRQRYHAGAGIGDDNPRKNPLHKMYHQYRLSDIEVLLKVSQAVYIHDMAEDRSPNAMRDGKGIRFPVLHEIYSVLGIN
jgi:hypothetical protein